MSSQISDNPTLINDSKINAVSASSTALDPDKKKNFIFDVASKHIFSYACYLAGVSDIEGLEFPSDSKPKPLDMISQDGKLCIRFTLKQVSSEHKSDVSLVSSYPELASAAAFLHEAVSDMFVMAKKFVLKPQYRETLEDVALKFNKNNYTFDPVYVSPAMAQLEFAKAKIKQGDIRYNSMIKKIESQITYAVVLKQTLRNTEFVDKDKIGIFMEKVNPQTVGV
jgi:hypothetical protein